MDYQAAAKLCFLLGFLCCWLITLTIRAAAGAVRRLGPRTGGKVPARPVQKREYREGHPS